jgi:hypothetical protein
LRWSRRLGLHGELGETKIRTHLDERRERPLPLDQRRQMSEAVVEAAKDVEDKGAVADGFTKISKLIRHGLETAAVIVDGQITLDERAELSVEKECTGLLVPDELLLQSEPYDPSCGRTILAVHHHLEEFRGDRAVEPREDDAVHALPSDVVGAIIIGESVIRERVPLERVEEEATPPVEVGRGEVEDERHEELDVDDGRRLGMESSGGCCDLAGKRQCTGVGVAAFSLQALCLLALSRETRGL